MEFGTKSCILFKPVFIVAFEPVNGAVTKAEEGNSAVYFVIILQTGNFVIFGQTALELGKKLIIGLVSYAKDAQTIVLQFPAETGKMSWKIGRNENKVFQGNHSISVGVGRHLEKINTADGEHGNSPA